MGAMCGCNTNNNDIVGFWKNMGLRSLTFDAYKKIYEKNQRKWLSSGENKRSVDIKKCEELFPLLDSVDFTEKQRKLYFDGLNLYINDLSDKLTFFTSLAFFTKVSNENEIKTLDEDRSAVNILDSIKNREESPKIHDLLFSHLIKMAIKRNDHDDVTKFFIEFVTEFPLQFVYLDKREIEERMQVYSKDNRDKLFAKIKMMNSQRFYEYMFNRDNVSHINNDLLKIHSENSSKELSKIRTGANVNQTNDTPGN
jgi:hypothetical protein